MHMGLEALLPGNSSHMIPRTSPVSDSSNSRQKLPNVNNASLSDDSVEGKPWCDIGTGTPEEVFREIELLRDLVTRYFTNFSDTHFMFDKECFLRELDVGGVPRVIVYSMMALGVR